MNRAELLIEGVDKVIVRGIEYSLQSSIMSAITIFRGLLTGVMTGRPPLNVKDVEEDNRWISEFPAIYGFFKEDKPKTLAWCGKLAHLLDTNATVNEINKFLVDSGLPEIENMLILAPTTDGEFT